jgi:colanic acid biosynthesis glycosyl transferase WcaI
MPNYPTGQIFAAYKGRLRLKEIWQGFPLHRVWLWAAKGAGMGRALNFLSFMAAALLPLRRVTRPDVIFVESPPLTLVLTALAYRQRVPQALLVLNIADQWIDAMRDFGIVTNRRVLPARRLSNVRFADPIPPETVLPLRRRAATTWPAGAGWRPPAGSSATW